MSHHEHGNSENHFYRGLFFGAILGIGLAYFLRTKEGQEVKNQLFEKGGDLIDEISNKVVNSLEDSSTP